jgi:Ca-activated chloride channel family protein
VRRRCTPAVVLLLAAAGARAGSWSDLWLRPDQQGQRELEAGHPSRAAELFTDPRRRAYAELEAKEYDAAQKRLAPLSDAESEYNRGNALARSGNLRTALDAYDAALKHGDADAALRRDARHNRDLVAKQLQTQDPQHQGGQSGDPKGDKGKDPSQDKSQAGSQDKGEPQSAQTQGGGTDQNASQTRASGSESGPSEEKSGREASGEAQQAQRDAREAVQQSQKSAQTPATSTGDDGRGQAQSTAMLPPSEQKLALDQWLRQIPDDPGGLLRRKFLIEHMIKQDAGGAP